MNNFARALRDSAGHWKALLLATLCSLGVALLWGGNIGALFPVIQVTLGGESLQQWVRHEIADSRTSIDRLGTEIEQLQGQLKSADAAQRVALRRQIDLKQSRIEAEQTSIRSSRKLKPWIDRYIPADPLHTVMLIIGVLVASTFIKHALLLGNTVLVARVSTNIARNLQIRLFRKALFLDRASFGELGTSGFATQITQTSSMLCNGIMNLYGGAVREPLKILACLVGACLISWRLLVLSLVIAPVVVVLIAWLSRRIKSVCRRTIDKAKGFNHVMLETLDSIQTVQAYGMEQVEENRFRTVTWDVLRLQIKSAFYNALTRPITELLGIGMVGTTVVIGSYLILYRETQLFGIQVTGRPLSISAMLTFFGLLIGASDPVRKLSSIFSAVNSGIAAADILYPLLDEPSRITSPPQPRGVPRPHHALKLEGVSFAYHEEDYVLRDVDLVVPFGSRIALIGANGSGKSSLVHLLCRFYDPSQGRILLDGVDLREMALDDLRGRIGLVTQQTELFNETILYNIRYGSLDASGQDAIRAARMAHAHEFIMALPDGYETRVGQGGQGLSGGQCQRIALARAILRDPELLILDEATSQIDPESERLINEALTDFSQGRTLIMITHRHSNLHLADRVYQLDRGRLVPQAHRAPRVA